MKRLFLLLLLLPFAAIAATILNSSYVKETSQFLTPSNASIPSLSVTGNLRSSTATITNKLGIGTNPASALHIRAPASSSSIFKMDDTNGSTRMHMGTLPGAPSFFAMWAGTNPIPGAANYQFATDGKDLYLQAIGSINFQRVGATVWSVGAHLTPAGNLASDVGDSTHFVRTQYVGQVIAVNATVSAGVLFPTNTVLPSAAVLGIGGYWVGNSNGFLVVKYSLDGVTTAMKILAP